MTSEPDPGLTECPNCGIPVPRIFICSTCGSEGCDSDGCIFPCGAGTDCVVCEEGEGGYAD